jgi:hypothetical protein
VSDLFLSDDPAPRRSRPRWVDGLGLAAVVLGIVAIGVLGDRGSPGREPAPTTTTSTTSTTSPPRSTTTSSEPSTTSTTLVQQLDGHIAVPTGALVLVWTGSTLTLIDVDAGSARRIEASPGYGLVGLDDGFLLPTGTAYRLLPADGGDLVDVPLVLSTDTMRLERAGPHTVWTFTSSPGNRTDGNEVDTRGRPTGRRFHLPAGVFVAEVVDGGVIAYARGSIVFVDGRDRARGLGTGEILAAGGRTLVRVTCEVLRCRTDVVDITTGRSHTVPVPDDLANGFAQQTELSPDGRWLASSLNSQLGGQRLVVVDLRTGRSWTADGIDSQAAIAFSPGSDVVFTTSTGSLCAFEVATSDRSCLDGLQAGQVGQLVAIPKPGG